VKYKFYKEKVESSGFIITAKKVETSQKNVNSIMHFKRPTLIKALSHLLGLTNCL
jgi:hypothetical protein